MIPIIICIFLTTILLSPLGCLVLWKRYGYLSDGFSHGCLLAATVAAVFDMSLVISAIIVTILFVAVIFTLKSEDKAENSAVIAVVANGFLGLSIILSVLYSNKINISYLLFGDILTSNYFDVIRISILCVVTLFFLVFYYKDLVITVISKEIAGIKNVNVNMLELMFLSLLSFSILFSLSVAGAMLINSMLLIPGLISRLFARSPVEMIFIASFISIMISFFSIIGSYLLDLPFAPLWVTLGLSFYLICYVKKR